MNKKVNIGLIGLGKIGKLHAENLVKYVEGANLLALAETLERIDAAVDVANKLKLNLFQVVDDYHEILNSPYINAIVICSSTDTHAQIITEAAKAKKHIFCEKPIDFDLKKTDKALEAVEKAEVKLQVGFNRRFDPDFAQIKHRISVGQVGAVRKIKIISRDPAPPPIDYIKVSGGMFMDMTIHDFDMARFLTDSEPEWIFAYGDVMVDVEIGQAGDIDIAEIIIGFKNGMIVTIDNCRESADGYDQRVEVLGSMGKIFNVNRRIDNTILSDKNGERASEFQNFFIERYAESYIREMQAFVNAVSKNIPVPVTGLDGKIPVLMALAAQKSLKEKRVVTLNEIKLSFAKATESKGGAE